MISSNILKKYNFTESQLETVDFIIDFLAKDFDDKRFIVGINGAGGTGKTYITKFIINHCKYSPSVITCCSPTHKACRVFSNAINRTCKVNTIQSTFGFRLDMKLEDFDPNNPKFSPIGKHKLENQKLIIIDESSMLPVKLINYIIKVCAELSIKIIFIGDNHQLPPVNEIKSTAFDKCFKVFTLSQVVRQESTNPIKNLLDIIRDDITNKTFKFFTYIQQHKNIPNFNENDKGFIIVDKNTFKNYIDSHFSDEEYTKDINLYRVLAYTNDRVTFWNNYIRNNIIKDSDKKIINRHDLIMSYTTIVDDFLSIIIQNSDEYIINNIVDYVDNKYGFKGFLIKFQAINGGFITKPIFIIDHRDKFTVLLYNKIVKELIDTAKAASGATRAACWKSYFKFKSTYLIAVNIKDKYTGKVVIEKDIDYGFALTSHKSQGSTYNTVFVDLNDMIYDKNGKLYTDIPDMLRRIYVACSRPTNKLYIAYG